MYIYCINRLAAVETDIEHGGWLAGIVAWRHGGWLLIWRLAGGMAARWRCGMRACQHGMAGCGSGAGWHGSTSRTGLGLHLSPKTRKTFILLAKTPRGLQGSLVQNRSENTNFELAGFAPKPQNAKNIHVSQRKLRKRPLDFHT